MKKVIVELLILVILSPLSACTSSSVSLSSSSIPAGNPTEYTSETDFVRMVRIDGTLYLDTGRESQVSLRCGVLDGEITTQVAPDQQPFKDGQSNFGTGYGYQYGANGTIELFLNGTWRVFTPQNVS